MKITEIEYDIAGGTLDLGKYEGWQPNAPDGNTVIIHKRKPGHH